MWSIIIPPLHQFRSVCLLFSRNRHLSYRLPSSVHSFERFQAGRQRSELMFEDHCCGIGGRRCMRGYYRLGHHNIGGDVIFKLGLSADVSLAVGKALTAYLSGSTAVMADAAHSLSDVVLSGIALLSFKVARAPKDKEHPYGHGKFETLGALGISCMLLATSGGIAWHAFDLLLGMLSAPTEVKEALSYEIGKGHDHNSHLDMDHPVLALSMMTVSICVKEGLYWLTKRAGESTGSGLMKANAWHHRSDAVSSVVALVGVGESVMELVDAALPSHQLEYIKKTTLDVEGVRGCHRVRGRRAGSSIYLDVHIEVDPFSSVIVGHDIGEKVCRQLCEVHGDVSEVFIHIDPSMSDLNPDSKNLQYGEALLKQENIEEMVSKIVFSRFTKKEMMVDSITLHPLQGGRHLLRIQVSMPQRMMPHVTTTISGVVGIANEMRCEILKAAERTTVSQVSFLLHLSP